MTTAQDRLVEAWEELEYELVQLREFKAKHSAVDCGRANMEKKVKAATDRALGHASSASKFQKWLNEVREERDKFRERMHELEEKYEELKGTVAQLQLELNRAGPP